MPQSLSGQFALALLMMVLLVLAGGTVAIQSLHLSAQASQSLTEERLDRLHDAQTLLQNTLFIELKSHLLLTAENAYDVQEKYRQILKLLDTQDQIVARFAKFSSNTTILELHQAGQLFRNTVHILARLRSAPLTTAQSTDASSTRRRQKYEKLMEQQGAALATAAEDVSNSITNSYRNAVIELSQKIRQRQWIVLFMLLASLLLAGLVSYHFRHHVMRRLLLVSRRLRLGKEDDFNARAALDGDDEIGEMARAVELFLQEHHQLEQTQQALKENEEMLRTITHAVQSAVVLIDDQDVIRFANPATVKLFGYELNELLGQRAHALLAPAELQARARAGLKEFARTGTGPLLNKPLELLVKHKGGTNVYINLLVGRIRKGDRWWAVATASDISAQKIREQQLADEAETDPLTGVKNRRSFLRLAEQVFLERRQAGSSLFLLMFDLDYFKEINDSYGHSVGDEVLREFASLCIQNLRSTDLFGRLGGEEFAALMRGKEIESVIGIAERIGSAFFHLTMRIEERLVKLETSVSIGLAQIDTAHDTVDDGLKRADAALYRAKAEGRNCIVVNSEVKQMKYKKNNRNTPVYQG